jgi:hypothetical protein
MDAHDLPPFAKIMTGLGELYGKAVSELLIEIYWSALKRFDLNAIREALNAHVNNADTGKFMPKPSDVIWYIEGDTTAKAAKAWSKVIGAVEKIGQYDSVIFDDALIHAVIADMGGWVAICCTKEKDIAWVMRDFEKRYEQYLVHKPIKYPRKLTGLLEVANREIGRKKSFPLLIGKEYDAIQVYLNGENYQHLRSRPLPIEEIKQVAAKISGLLTEPEE